MIIQYKMLKNDKTIIQSHLQSSPSQRQEETHSAEVQHASKPQNEGCIGCVKGYAIFNGVKD